MYDNGIEKICATCEHASFVYPSGAVYCDKRGPVEEFGTCRKYRFDALKFQPDVPFSIDRGAR